MTLFETSPARDTRKYNRVPKYSSRDSIVSDLVRAIDGFHVRSLVIHLKVKQNLDQSTDSPCEN